MIKSSQRLSPLDAIDFAILNELQINGRIKHTDLARQVNLSAPAMHARIRRLEKNGFIREYVALVDRELAGYDMLCLIHVSMALHQHDQIENFRTSVQKLPEVLECYHVTGEHDYLLKVVVRNRKDLERFVIRRLTSISGIAQIRTSLVLSEIKATTALPLPPLSDESS